MRTSSRHVGDVTIVDLRGRLVFGEGSASVHDMVCDLLNKGHRKILLNLGGVTYIDGAGLGTLVGSFASARKHAGELKLFNPRSKVTYVLQITKLHTVFEIMKDEAVGVESFGTSKEATAVAAA
jgi:anti-sigma B factor antagonist